MIGSDNVSKKGATLHPFHHPGRGTAGLVKCGRQHRAAAGNGCCHPDDETQLQAADPWIIIRMQDPKGSLCM